MPIKKAIQGPDGDTELTDKVISVVNIDSKMENAPDYYRNHMVDGRSLWDRQEQALREISEYCSFRDELMSSLLRKRENTIYSGAEIARCGERS